LSCLGLIIKVVVHLIPYKT
jgi:hypothetical protein